MSAQIIPFPETNAAVTAALVPAFLLIDRGDVDSHKSLLARGTALGKIFVEYRDLTKEGTPRESSFPNAHAFMDAFGVGVKYDTFTYCYYVTGVPHQHRLDDAAHGDIRMAMAATGLKCSKEFLWDFLKARGRETRYNPLLDFLNGLKWDGTARLDTAIIRHLGAEDSDYVRAATRAWHIGVMQRLRHPGCKFDNVLTLLGEEGLLKSTYFREMGYDIYFTDCLPLGADPKITFEVMKGKMIGEFADLAGMQVKEDEHVKACITRQVDEARGAWDVETRNVPRQFGLGSSANKNNPLKGAYGNRRWWTIGCTHKLVLDALRAERDQLWAEAMHHAKAGEQHWLSDEMERQARVVQHTHTSVHPLQARIEEALEGLQGFVPIKELYACIGIEDKDVSRLNKGHQDIIEAAMARLKFKKTRKWVTPQADGGVQPHGYESAQGWGHHVLHWTGSGFVQEAGDIWQERQRQRAAI
jgi:predicted P-loop ATPase